MATRGKGIRRTVYLGRETGNLAGLQQRFTVRGPTFPKTQSSTTVAATYGRSTGKRVRSLPDSIVSLPLDEV